jgi:hypothetical protein
MVLSPAETRGRVCPYSGCRKEAAQVLQEITAGFAVALLANSLDGCFEGYYHSTIGEEDSSKTKGCMREERQHFL